MFQLNKRTIVFLVLFSIILIGITIGAIFYTNSHNVSDSSEVVIEGKTSSTKAVKTLIDDGVKGINLSDRYDVNDLKISDTEYIPSENSEYRIRYCQISGLKDESVQNKINQEIKDTVFNIYDDLKKSKNNIKRINVDAFCFANFADVLSITINSYMNFGDNEYTNLVDGLNYRLDTGEKIKFTDLFTYNTGIKNIMISEIYKDMAWSYNNGNYEEDTDMDKVDYQDIEERVYSFINDYLRSDNPKFSFTENNIYIYKDNQNYSISMYDYYENIAIYNRFVSDIYELNKIPVLTSVYIPKSYSCYYEDDSCTILFQSRDGKEYDFYKFDILETIEAIKKECSNDGKGIYYEAYLSIRENDGKIEVSRDSSKYISNKSDYKKYVFDVIIEQKRKKLLDAVNHYYTVDENYVKTENDYSKTYYNPENKEKIIEEEKKPENTVTEQKNNTQNNAQNTIVTTNDHTSGVDTNNTNSNTIDADVIIENNNSNTNNNQGNVIDTVVTVE